MPSTWAMMQKVVKIADHVPGRDDGGPLGRRFCWSGSKVVNDHPKPTQHTLKRRDIMPGDASDAAIGTSARARCILPNRKESWQHGVLLQ
jgi:hypothetical protein